eukprot:2389286-Rhodomonas_salina.4
MGRGPRADSGLPTTLLKRLSSGPNHPWFSASVSGGGWDSIRGVDNPLTPFILCKLSRVQQAVPFSRGKKAQGPPGCSWGSEGAWVVQNHQYYF